MRRADRTEARKARALQRQAERAKRSASEQLARLDAGGHRAARERARLAKQLTK